MSVRRRIGKLASEAAIYGVSGVIGRFIAIFLVPIYTRVFSPADYGVYSLLGVFAGLVAIFAVLALDNSSARWFYDTDDPDDRRTTISSWFWCQLVVSSALASVMLVLAPQVSSLLTDSAEHANLVRLVAAAIPLSVGGTVLGSWLRYQRRATPAMIFGVSQTLVGVGLILLFVVGLGRGLAGLFTAQLITQATICVVAVAIMRTWIAPSAFSWQRLLPMLRYAMPLIPAALGFWIMASMDRVMLGAYTDTAEVGLYAIGAAVAAGVTLVTGAFAQAWGPFAYSILGQPDARRVYSRVLDLYCFFGSALCVALALFAPLIMRVFTTEIYYPAASTVAFLAFAALLLGVQYIASLGCGIAKKSGAQAATVAIGAGVNVVLNMLLIPRFGREGAALATMIAWALSAAALFFASQHYYRIPYRWSIAVAPFLWGWLLIGIDHWFNTEAGTFAYLFHGGLLLTFIPLGAALGLIRRADVKEALTVIRPPRQDRSRKQ